MSYIKNLEYVIICHNRLYIQTNIFYLICYLYYKLYCNTFNYIVNQITYLKKISYSYSGVDFKMMSGGEFNALRYSDLDLTELTSIQIYIFVYPVIYITP